MQHRRRPMKLGMHTDGDAKSPKLSLTAQGRDQLANTPGAVEV